MPCYDPGGYPTAKTEYVNGVDPQYKRDAEEYKKKCDILTDLLCKAGRARKNKTDIPKEVLNWWDKHEKSDRKRGEPW